jgi:hypothetical protein
MLLRPWTGMKCLTHPVSKRYAIPFSFRFAGTHNSSLWVDWTQTNLPNCR